MRLFFTFFVVLLCTSAYTQLDNQSKIVDFLGQEKFDQLQTDNPNYVAYLDTRITSGYEVKVMSAEKTTGFTVLNQVNLFDSADKNQSSSLTAEQVVQQHDAGTFNVLKCDLNFDKSQMTYYVLGSTGKVLMLYPADYISEKLNSK